MDPKKGTGKKPKGSGRRLYTDENPRDTVRIKLNKLAVQLGKSAKLHANQAKVVKGIIRGSKKRNGKKA